MNFQGTHNYRSKNLCSNLGEIIRGHKSGLFFSSLWVGKKKKLTFTSTHAMGLLSEVVCTEPSEMTKAELLVWELVNLCSVLTGKNSFEVNSRFYSYSVIP